MMLIPMICEPVGNFLGLKFEVLFVGSFRHAAWKCVTHLGCWGTGKATQWQGPRGVGVQVRVELDGRPSRPFLRRACFSWVPVGRVWADAEDAPGSDGGCSHLSHSWLAVEGAGRDTPVPQPCRRGGGSWRHILLLCRSLFKDSFQDGWFSHPSSISFKLFL